MVIFYGQAIEGKVILDEGESLHLCKVLRIVEGEQVQVLDGKGSLYHCKVVRSHAKQSILEIERSEFEERGESRLSIAIAPTKGNDRFDWFLEKSVELGVDRIFALKTKRMEKIKFNRERAEKILIAGMKQSGNRYLPEISELVGIEEVLKEDGIKGIGYCGEMGKMSLGEFSKMEGRVIFFIGPEGDFTEDEVEKVLSNGGKVVELGKNRLRTETAAIHVLSWYYGLRG